MFAIERAPKIFCRVAATSRVGGSRTLTGSGAREGGFRGRSGWWSAVQKRAGWRGAGSSATDHRWRWPVVWSTSEGAVHEEERLSAVGSRSNVCDRFN